MPSLLQSGRLENLWGDIGTPDCGAAVSTLETSQTDTSPETPNPKLDAALEYSSLHGMAVFPCHSIADGDCTCGKTLCESPGKHPRTDNGVYDATTDPTTIRRWWTRWPDANVAIATGQPSGLVVVDIDGPKGFQAFKERCGDAVPGPMVKTGKGFHVYCQMPTDTPVTNRVRVLPEVDIRATGGYVIMPPGDHVSGRQYQWCEGLGLEDTKPGPLPKWLLTSPAPSPSTESRGPITNGGRNDYLYRQARRYHAQGRSPDEIRALIRAENQILCSPPLGDYELSKLIENSITQPDRADWVPGDDHDTGSRDDLAFNPERVGALLVEPEVEPVAIWDRWIFEGTLTMMASGAKVGKTSLLYPTVVAIAQGKPFLGFKTRRTPVLILALEEHPAMVTRHLRAAGATEDDPIWVHRGGIGREYDQAIKAFCKEHKIGLLVVDTLSEFWDIKEENSNRETGAWLQPWRQFAHKNNIAVLMVHHEGKQSNAPAEKALRGGSAILGAVDQLLTLKRLTKDDRLSFKPPLVGNTHRFLSPMGRFGDYSPRRLLIDRKGPGQYVPVKVYESASEIADPEVPSWAVPVDLDRDKLMATLTDKPQTVPDLAAVLGWGVTKAREELGKVSDQVVREEIATGKPGKAPVGYRLRGPADGPASLDDMPIDPELLT